MVPFQGIGVLVDRKVREPTRDGERRFVYLEAEATEVRVLSVADAHRWIRDDAPSLTLPREHSSATPSLLPRKAATPPGRP